MMPAHARTAPQPSPNRGTFMITEYFRAYPTEILRDHGNTLGRTP
jgi:hypothetical protein